MASFTAYKGHLKTLKQLQNLKKGSAKEFGDAAMAETQIEVVEVKANTPVKTGALRDGIHAVGPEYEGKIIRTRIRTSQDTADYALIQHEDLDLDHTVGGPKFIERPLGESSKHLPQRITNRVDLNRVK